MLRRLCLLVALSAVACDGTESSSGGVVDGSVDAAAVSDASVEADGQTDADASDADICCPISELGCCMRLGGVRSDANPCYEICDDIPTDFEKRVDEAGCPYWYDPPGGGKTCTFGGPPDAGPPG